VIRRIAIAGYKSLGHVELTDLGPLVVVFGPNGSGKSNLLDALDLLSHVVRKDTLVQAFTRHRGNRLDRPLPVGQLFRRGPDERKRLSFEVDLELSPAVVEQVELELTGHKPARLSQRRLRYELSIEYDADARRVLVTHEALLAITETGDLHAGTKPYIRHDTDEEQLWVKLEARSHPRVFSLPRNRTALSEVNDVVRHPHLVAAARELAGLRMYYVEPTAMRAEASDVETTEPGAHGEHLAAFFHWLGREYPIRMRDLEQNLAQLVPGVRGLRVRPGNDGFLAMFLDEEGVGEIPASLASEGTLRLLCLLAIAASPLPPALVGYEEPENGVEPSRLSIMLEIISTRAQRRDRVQYLITTHSRQVIDGLGGATHFRCARGTDGSVMERVPDPPLLRLLAGESSVGEVELRSTLGERVERGDFG